MAPKISKVKTTIVLIFQVIAVSASMQDCQTHCEGLDGRDLCVTADLMCNHEADCINSEDEDPVLCACGGLRCIGNCLDAFIRCNGVSNCLDHSDEINCTKSDYKHKFPALQGDDLCKMPCGRRGSCSFDSDNKAVCVCDDGYSGVSCENEYLTPQFMDDMIRASRENAIDPEQSSTYSGHDSNDSRSFWLMMAFIVLLCGMLIRCYGICFGSESGQIRKSSVSWIKTAARVTYIYTPTKPLDSDESMTKPPV